VIAKISIYDEKIKQARDNIDMSRRALVQMDSAVDQTMSRSTTETGADKAAQLRRSQAAERNRLLKEIDAEQRKIQALNDQRAPIAAEVRKVEAEVGPIKYIAALIYGDNPEANVLEKAVRWVIILIVVVFDPLAVMMLLAATESRSWVRSIIPPPPAPPVVTPPPAQETPRTRYEPVPRTPRNRVRRKRKAQLEALQNLDQKKTEPVLEEDFDDHPEETAAVKEAKRQWKADNPDKTLKEQRHLLAQGAIDHLPWENYLPESDPVPFGQILPDNAIKGYQFLHTGYIPSKLFKFNGYKWIEVDKSLTDRYAYNNAYAN
jgi:hypothetical protein